MGSVRGGEAVGGGALRHPVTTLYLKVGADGARMGACPFCQRVLMVSLLKAQHNAHMQFKVRSSAEGSTEGFGEWKYSEIIIS